MSNASSRVDSLTPSPVSRSPSPEPPIQPDHFYPSEHAHQLPPSPESDGRTWLDPNDDPTASRGIPVFKPTMEEFKDFEGYLNKIECWGMKSGIVKVIPPKEWKDTLPSVTPQLGNVKLKNPIEQHMLGRGGLFRQENVEKRRVMSVREWAELCAKEDFRAPGVDDTGLHARAMNGNVKPRTRRARRKRESETAEPEANEIKEEEEAPAAHAPDAGSTSLASPPNSISAVSPHPEDDNTEAEATNNSIIEHVAEHQLDAGVSNDVSTSDANVDESKADPDEQETKSRAKGKRPAQGRKSKEASLADRAERDKVFLEAFDPHSDWLPSNTTPFDYTPEFCRELERRYWRNCGLGKPAWYGADMAGSLFTEETKHWNVASLYSALSRLLPAESKGLPGVNTPYLYFGMWRATFAWHVEDMDLFSINYIHFGAPKHWYAIPQARANALEQTMRGYFPKDVSNCSQFLRHKSFLASPRLLASDACRPNTLVQHAGEFVITFPMGYHAGFNLGFNCAESVNFALESWLDLGRKAKACGCVNFSVRIDVDQLLHEREAERLALGLETNKPRRPKSDSKARKDSKSKRPLEEDDNQPRAKKQKTVKSAKSDTNSAEASSSKLPKASPTKVTLKLGPKPKEPDTFPCCLCVSMSQENLLRVQDPPEWRLPQADGAPAVDAASVVWMAHENCANVIPETWVDVVEVGDVREDGTRAKERVVFGVDAIVKDRWNLRCTACTKTRHRAHGAPIQCTKGKCPKAFHVTCARDGSQNNIVYKELREVEKEVVLLEPLPASAAAQQPAAESSGVTLAPAQPPLDAAAAGIANSAELTGPRVLKMIRKVEVQVLCSQHNPAVTDAKRAQKQDRIRNNLLALPQMSRIKLRVSAGIWEVSLLRVIEETSSVEVLWDRGVKREFKWGSVVFGNTEGLTIGQKPTEAAPELEQLVPPRPSNPSRVSFHSSTPVPGNTSRQASIPASTPAPIVASMTPTMTTTPTGVPQAAPPAYTYQYPTTWKYSYFPNTNQGYATAGPSGQAGYSYGSSGQPMYSPPAYSAYGGYHYQAQPPPQPPPQPQPQVQSQPPPFQSRGLQWQRPYTGPKVAETSDAPVPVATTQTVPYYGQYNARSQAPAHPPAQPQPWPGTYMASTGTPSNPPTAHSSVPP